MKIAKLVHNPTAGDEEHSKKSLIRQIEKAGYQCRYSSTKTKSWKEIENDTELIIVAGGDGTVRKVVKEMLERHILDRNIPIAVFPLGTANNVANTLGIKASNQQLVQPWENFKIKGVDVGSIYNKEEVYFFLESFGYGIFPYLMQVMKKSDKEWDSPEEELKGALKTLHQIILDYEPRKCKLTLDGADHSGTYILAEIMNTQSIGPNLKLAPDADPGDGVMEIVLVKESDKEKFALFIEQLISEKEVTYRFETYRAKEISIAWNGTHIHVDDEVIKFKENVEVKIEVKKGALQFLVPLQ